MSYEYTSRFQPQYLKLVPWMLLVLVLGAVGVLFATHTIIFSSSLDTPQGRAMLVRLMAEKNAELSQLISSVEKNLAWKTERGRTEQLRTRLGELQAAEKALQAEFARLETTNAGNSLADDEGALGCFLALREHPRIDPLRFKTDQDRCESYLQLCDQFLSDPNAVLPETGPMPWKLNDIERQITQSQSAIDNDQNALRALLQTCPKNTTGEPTLSSAVEQWRNKRGRYYLAKLADEHAFRWKHADEENDERIRKQRDAETAKANLEQSLRLARAKAKAERAKQIVDGALADLKALDVGQADREQQAENIQVMQPVTSGGIMQLDRLQRWVPSPGSKRPVSWSALEAAHVLQPGEIGFRNFEAICAADRSLNDRSLSSVVFIDEDGNNTGREKSLRMIHRRLLSSATSCSNWDFWTLKSNKPSYYWLPEGEVRTALFSAPGRHR